MAAPMDMSDHVVAGDQTALSSPLMTFASLQQQQQQQQQPKSSPLSSSSSSSSSSAPPVESKTRKRKSSVELSERVDRDIAATPRAHADDFSTRHKRNVPVFTPEHRHEVIRAVKSSMFACLTQWNMVTYRDQLKPDPSSYPKIDDALLQSYITCAMLEVSQQHSYLPSDDIMSYLDTVAGPVSSSSASSSVSGTEMEQLRSSLSGMGFKNVTLVDRHTVTLQLLDGAEFMTIVSRPHLHNFRVTSQHGDCWTVASVDDVTLCILQYSSTPSIMRMNEGEDGDDEKHAKEDDDSELVSMTRQNLGLAETDLSKLDDAVKESDSEQTFVSMSRELDEVNDPRDYTESSHFRNTTTDKKYDVWYAPPPPPPPTNSAPSSSRSSPEPTAASICPALDLAISVFIKECPSTWTWCCDMKEQRWVCHIGHSAKACGSIGDDLVAGLNLRTSNVWVRNGSAHVVECIGEPTNVLALLRECLPKNASANSSSALTNDVVMTSC